MSALTVTLAANMTVLKRVLAGATVCTRRMIKREGGHSHLRAIRTTRTAGMS